MKNFPSFATGIIFFLLLSSNPINAQVPDSGLVAHYSFTNGSLQADIGGVNGTPSNILPATDRFGLDSNALEFNRGQNSFVSLGDNFDAVISGPNQKFSFSIWFKRNDTLPEPLLSKYGNINCSENQRQFFLVIRPDNKVEFLYFMSKTVTNFRGVRVKTPITDNDWHHLVVNYDGQNSDNDGLDRVNIYIDNVLQGVELALNGGSLLNSLPDPTAHFGVGHHLSSSGTLCGTGGFDGYLDDFRIYSRNLTPSEVTQLFLEGGCSSSFVGVTGYNAALTWPSNSNAVRHCLEISDTNGNSKIKYTSDTSFTFRLPPGQYSYRVFYDTSGANDFSDSTCLQTFEINCSPFDFKINKFQSGELGRPSYVRLFNVGQNGEDRQAPYDFLITNGVDTFTKENKRQHRFPGLPPGNYQALVTDAYGCSATDSFSIAELDTTYVPKIFKAANAPNCGFKVIWHSIDSPFLKKYQAAYRSLSEPSLPFKTIAPTTVDTTQIFDGLEGGKTYEFYVRARIDTGTGAYFSPWSFSKVRGLDTSGCLPPAQAAKKDSPSESEVFGVSEIKTFPNPFSNILMIESRNYGISQIAIFTVEGKAVFSKNYEAKNVLELDLEHLPQGIYFLKITENGQIYTEKIWKE